MSAADVACGSDADADADAWPVACGDGGGTPGSCRAEVAALLANCSAGGRGPPVCPATDAEAAAALFSAASYGLLLLSLVFGTSFNALSVVTLSRRRHLKTLCNRLVLAACALDALFSSVFPVIQMVSLAAKDARWLVELAWVAVVLCAPRRFIIDLAINIKFNFIITIALLRYLRVCHNLDPRPTLKNTLLVSLPGILSCLVRHVNSQFQLTWYCSRPYAVTTTGWVISSTSYGVDADNSSVANAVRTVMTVCGMVAICFFYGAIAVKAITTRLRVRRSSRRQVTPGAIPKSERLQMVFSSLPGGAARSGSSGGSGAGSCHSESDLPQGDVPVPPPPSSSEPEGTVIFVLSRPENGGQELPRAGRSGSVGPAAAGAGQPKPLAAGALPPVEDGRQSTAGPECGPAAARANRRLSIRRQFGRFLTVPGPRAEWQSPAAPPARRGALSVDALPPAAVLRQLPVRRAFSPEYDVLTSITLLVHLLVYLLSFLPTILAMSLLHDPRVCYQMPLQHQVFSFLIILLFFVQTSLNTPALLLFSSEFRVTLVKLLRDAARRPCRRSGPAAVRRPSPH